MEVGGARRSTGRRLRAVLAVLLLAGCDAGGGRAVPPGYPRGYATTIAAAEREGRLAIWSTTDAGQVRELLAGFRARHPRIAVSYADISADTIQRRLLADARAGRGTADLVWSSAMDLQIKLVNDGFAQRYVSPEAAALPGWANWKDEAWGVTAEPIVMVYNRRLIDPAAVPRSHVALRQLLERTDLLRGRIATYDPLRSAVGYLYLSQDGGATRDLWRMVQALARNRAALFTTSEAIIDAVAAGRAAVGYNVVGSYVADAMRRHPDLGIVLPRDYTLVMSRIAIVPTRAPHPNAAHLFLDYLLSREGQRALALHALPSVRRDLPVPATLRAGMHAERAIRVGPALLVQQDRLTRSRFAARWRAAMDPRSVGPGQLDP